MATIYNINKSESKKEQIPSMEYMIQLIENIEEALLYKHDSLPSIKTSIKDLPIGIKQQDTVHAKEVKTDSNHKFISDAILNTLSDKPTKFEMQQSITEVKQEVMAYNEELYKRIINTQNVLQKLRDISTILNEDEILSELFNILATKVDFHELNNHANSHLHLDNNDRKALNVLLSCLACGFADWDADDGDYNAIKNKPKSLPANGGNASTVANHGIKELINKNDYEIVIGNSNGKYSKDTCDIYAKDGVLLVEELESSLKSINYKGRVLFKEGDYSVDTINCNLNNYVVYSGIHNMFSKIHNCKFRAHHNLVDNIGFESSIIFIYADCEFNNVSFENCTIIFDSSVGCNITNCKFVNCKFEYKGSIINNLVKFNRFIHTKPIQYIGGNNIISENF